MLLQKSYYAMKLKYKKHIKNAVFPPAGAGVVWPEDPGGACGLSADTGREEPRGEQRSGARQQVHHRPNEAIRGVRSGSYLGGMKLEWPINIFEI